MGLVHRCARTPTRRLRAISGVRATRRTSSGSFAPAGSGAISRRATPNATRCTPGCWRYRTGSRRSSRLPATTPITWRSPVRSFIAASATVPTGTGRSAASTCRTCRNAIYRGLIAADNALDDAEGRTGPWVRHDVGDFNLDARQEVRLENDQLDRSGPSGPGRTSYELDVRESATNVLATLDRRPRRITPRSSQPPKPRRVRADRAPAASQGEATSFKQPGLDRLLIYDRHPRKALVDHFYPVDVTLDDLVAGRDVECGDFVTGTYLARVQRDARRVAVIMERPGRAGRSRDTDQEDDRARGRQAGTVGSLRSR